MPSQYPQNPTQNEPFYYNDLVLILSLFCCWPVGIILIWTGNKWTKGVRIGITGFFGFLFVVGLIGSMTAPKPGSCSGLDSYESTQKADSPKEVAPEFISETCFELAENFGASSQLSELQKEEIWKQYRGKAFDWQLEVSEVHSGILGGFSVQYKCAPNSNSLLFDIQVEYSDSQKPAVLQLMKGKTYQVQGKLTRSGSILGMSAKAL